jgi:hypothetical protein
MSFFYFGCFHINNEITVACTAYDILSLVPSSLQKCFSNTNVQRNHLGISLRCRCWFCRSVVQPEILFLTSSQIMKMLVLKPQGLCRCSCIILFIISGDPSYYYPYLKMRSQGTRSNLPKVTKASKWGSPGLLRITLYTILFFASLNTKNHITVSFHYYR